MFFPLRRSEEDTFFISPLVGEKALPASWLHPQVPEIARENAAARQIPSLGISKDPAKG
jgi:hypothetical protein